MYLRGIPRKNGPPDETAWTWINPGLTSYLRISISNVFARILLYIDGPYIILQTNSRKNMHYIYFLDINISFI